jgi:hypothetical protein
MPFGVDLFVLKCRELEKQMLTPSFASPNYVIRRSAEENRSSGQSIAKIRKEKTRFEMEARWIPSK